MNSTLTKTNLFNGIKEIPLCNSNLFAIVDEQDYDYLMQWEWNLTTGARKQFLVFRALKNSRCYLHREIVCLYQNHVATVKHLNGNTLDNRRSNLEAISIHPRIAKRRKDALMQNKEEIALKHEPLTPISNQNQQINNLKRQRLLSAQQIINTKNAIAISISQLQQIHANLEQTLEVLKP